MREFINIFKKLKDIPQDYQFHSEGDPLVHTGLCLKEMNDICIRHNITGDDKSVLIFSTLLHDVGKLTTTVTEFVEKHNRFCITSKGHEEESARLALPILQSLDIKQSLIDRIIPLIKYHLSFVNILNLTATKGRKSALLKLSRKLSPSTISELLYLYEADFMGRVPYNETREQMRMRFESNKNEILNISIPLDIVNQKRNSILMGKHLIAKGLTPGIIFGTILRFADEAQDNLEFTNLDEANIWLQEYISRNNIT